MTERVDFHIHYDPLDESTAYDAIETARKCEVTAMALMARGQISVNTHEFIEKGRELGIKVFSGLESLTILGDNFLELICLGFDPEGSIAGLYGQEVVEKINKKAVFEQLAFIQTEGFDFSLISSEDQELLSKVKMGKTTERAFKICQIISRSSNIPNISRISALKKELDDDWKYVNDKYGNAFKGSNLNAKFLWYIYFKVGAPGYIRVQNHADVVINAVHESGGVVLYSPEGKFDFSVWESLISLGVDGVMGWHGSKLELSRQMIKDLLEKEMLILGGSDFDPIKNHWKLGLGDGSLYINPRRLLSLESRLLARV